MYETHEIEQDWIFTFGVGHEHAGHYVKIHGTYRSARDEMVRRHGRKWAFQYTEHEWQDWLRRKPDGIKAETELKEDEHG